ncbi:hypothetical protein ACHAXS_005300 [Conticribra weissflogii]
MPKRPNSSRTPSKKDDSKRPRIEFEDDIATSPPPSASQVASDLSFSNNAAVASSVAAAAVPSLPGSAGKPSVRSAKDSLQSSDTNKSNVSAVPAVPLDRFTVGATNGTSSGKNSYLCAQREANNTKSSKNARGGSESAYPIRDKSKKNDGLTTPKSGQTTDVVEEKNKPNFRTAVLTLFLLAVNIASVAYILAQETRHNVSLMQCSLDVDNLKEELAKNRDLVAVLKSGMDEAQRRILFLEQANGSKVRAVEGRKKESGDVATSQEEKSQWLEKIEQRQEDEKELMRKLRYAIGKFEM